MLVTAFIIIISLALLTYWFRYSCMLLLRSRAEEASASQTVLEPSFHFPEVQERLRTQQALDPLHESLLRDYQVLTYLIEHASSLAPDSLEDRLLVLDYKLMQWWYRIARIAWPAQARQALSEMASVIAVLAHRVSERAAA